MPRRCFCAMRDVHCVRRLYIVVLNLFCPSRCSAADRPNLLLFARRNQSRKREAPPTHGAVLLLLLLPGGERTKGPGKGMAGNRGGCGTSTPGRPRQRRRTCTRASPRRRPCCVPLLGRPCRRLCWARGRGGRRRRTRRTVIRCSITLPPSCVPASPRR